MKGKEERDRERLKKMMKTMNVILEENQKLNNKSLNHLKTKIYLKNLNKQQRLMQVPMQPLSHQAIQQITLLLSSMINFSSNFNISSSTYSKLFRSFKCGQASTSSLTTCRISIQSKVSYL